MAETEGYSVEKAGGGLTIRGPAIDEDPDAAWQVKELDERRLLVAASEGDRRHEGQEAGLARCSSEILRNFLLGLAGAGWSGVVTVDTGYGVKKLYFNKGEITFAASNVIDDRLGEVIYRQAKITLDELTNSAAQVSKKQKFGQVLLSSGIFNNVHLWQALKLQVAEIIRSIFMVDSVWIEMERGEGLAPTEIIFDEGTVGVLNEAYSYGCSFRSFLAGLRAESECIVLHDKDVLAERYKAGSFIGDLLALIAEESNVQELLNRSKLTDINTIAAIADLVHEGIIAVKPHFSERPKQTKALAPLKAKLDAYAYVLQQVRKAFADAKREFPLMDLHLFTAALNPTFRSLYVDGTGALSQQCINSIFSQCENNPSRIEYFLIRIESMIQFLLQLTGDNLEWSVASSLRQDYRSISG